MSRYRYKVDSVSLIKESKEYLGIFLMLKRQYKRPYKMHNRRKATPLAPRQSLSFICLRLSPEIRWSKKSKETETNWHHSSPMLLVRANFQEAQIDPISSLKWKNTRDLLTMTKRISWKNTTFSRQKSQTLILRPEKLQFMLQSRRNNQ